MTQTLYRGGAIYSASAPDAQAMVVDGSIIRWIGSDAEAQAAGFDGAAQVVDLDGALVTPAFIDAHAHLFEAGLAASSVDLSIAAGATSLRETLDMVGVAARRSGGNQVLGHGWDDSRWPEGRPPTRLEVDAISNGVDVMLTRADLQAAVVSSQLAQRAGAMQLPGWRDSGLVDGEALLAVRAATRPQDPAAREAVYRAALQRAAAAGIAIVHELSTESLDSRAGLQQVLAMTAEAASQLPRVVGYRAELVQTEAEARQLLAEVPHLAGIGGDLQVDGSIAARTAALRDRYADLPVDNWPSSIATEPADSGTLYLSVDEIRDHVAIVTKLGLQTGFHVVGDRGLATVLAGIEAAAELVGLDPVRAAGHRLEHVEMVDAAALAHLVLLGVTASVQPSVGQRWGGEESIYAKRLGVGRAMALNPIADLIAAGVPVAFGSNAPVGAFDPWGAVRAAMTHHDAGQQISAADAFAAHTAGGRNAAAAPDHPGQTLEVGSPATFAVWHTEDLVTTSARGRIAPWVPGDGPSQPPMPDLRPEAAAPKCLRTVRDGVTIFDALT